MTPRGSTYRAWGSWTVTRRWRDGDAIKEIILPEVDPRQNIVTRLVLLVRHVFIAAAVHCYVCGCRVLPKPGALSRVCSNDLCQFHVVETPKYWCGAAFRARAAAAAVCL
jgi:hypothetical protein